MDRSAARALALLAALASPVFVAAAIVGWVEHLWPATPLTFGIAAVAVLAGPVVALAHLATVRDPEPEVQPPNGTNQPVGWPSSTPPKATNPPVGWPSSTPPRATNQPVGWPSRTPAPGPRPPATVAPAPPARRPPTARPAWAMTPARARSLAFLAWRDQAPGYLRPLRSRARRRTVSTVRLESKHDHLA